MFVKRLIGIIGGTLLAGAAWGTSFTFMADGVTEGAAQQGTASFNFAPDLQSMTITLTNNASPTSMIASELDGLMFSLSGGASASLTGITPTSVIDCSNTASPCPPAVGQAFPYTWGLTNSGGFFSLGSGFSGGTPYQPFGIVNANYSANGTDGLSSPSTNPLFLGPVVFAFSLSGANGMPEIGNVTMLFGALPNAQFAVPEPQSLALLGLGLLSLVYFTRRRRQQ